MLHLVFKIIQIHIGKIRLIANPDTGSNDRIKDRINILNEILKAMQCMLKAIDKIFKKKFIHPDGYLDNMIYDSIKNEAHYIDFDNLLLSKDSKGFLMTDISRSLESILMM